MTADDVARRVEEIRQMAGDDEMAHGREDDLHREVLAAIRDGKADNPAECARVALTTQAIDFCRFYALNFEE